MLSKAYQKIFLPEKLKEQLAKIPYFPVTVVEAPSGFGKTTALREYLNATITDNARQYWYTCLSESPLVAWMGICDMFSNISFEMARNLKKLGFPTMETLMYISAAFKDIDCKDEIYIVIDNYQIIKSDLFTGIDKHIFFAWMLTVTYDIYNPKA